MKKIGIIGGAGYTAGELFRILINHPKVEIDFIYSTSSAGKPVYSIHEDLMGDTEMLFTDVVNPEVDVIFLCLGHGNSKAFLEENQFSESTKIIDLSNDFRLNPEANFKGKNFVYGLPELQKDKIKTAQYIANPGCFATAIQLALLPLAKESLLSDDVHINATTGSTGAGIKPTETTHFSWRANNMSHYKAFDHQHLGEIRQSLTQLQTSFDKELLFIPNRGDFTRGIFMTAYLPTEKNIDEILNIYQEYYKDEPFVVVTDKAINLKQVVQTNKCIISLMKKGKYVLLTSIIDNLIKGASGQAIQNMNLMFGWEETLGLKLKSGRF